MDKLENLKRAIEEGLNSGISSRTVKQIWDDAEKKLFPDKLSIVGNGITSKMSVVDDNGKFIGVKRIVLDFDAENGIAKARAEFYRRLENGLPDRYGSINWTIDGVDYQLDPNQEFNFYLEKVGSEC